MKGLLLSILVLFAISLNAQVRVGLTAGGQFTLLSPQSDLGLRSGGSFVPSGGIIADIRADRSFYIESGLIAYNFKYQNTNIEAYDQVTGNDLGEVSSHNLTYIQLPVNFLVKAPSGKSRLVAGGGIFAAINITDNLRLKQPLGTANAVIIGTDGINPVIVGVTTKVGLESGKIAASFQFQRILNNIYKRPNAGQPLTWRGFSLGVQLAYYIR